jgi:dihydroorotate dehydrogenase
MTEVRERAGSMARVPKQTYRFDQSFEWNYEHGPDFDGPWPRVPVTPMKSFFGYPVRSRFGIPASILPSSRWVEAYARLGFDILTYKTVRSVPRLCGAAPNWVILDAASIAPGLADSSGAIKVAAHPPRTTIGVTTGGSFGLPSKTPDVWRADIARARGSIGEGQVFICSVVGTAGPDITDEAFVADFGQLARWVADAGAQIVEVDLSCPNVGSAEGMLYLNVALCARITRAVKDAARDQPVLLKIGYIEDRDRLFALMQAVSGMADGLVLINAPARRIVTQAGERYFAPGRDRAGVTGAAIKPIALRAVREGMALIEHHKLPLQVIGCGGITSPDDVREFLAAGACAAVSGTGAMFNPYLASELKAIAPDI